MLLIMLTILDDPLQSTNDIPWRYQPFRWAASNWWRSRPSRYHDSQQSTSHNRWWRVRVDAGTCACDRRGRTCEACRRASLSTARLGPSARWRRLWWCSPWRRRHWCPGNQATSPTVSKTRQSETADPRSIWCTFHAFFHCNTCLTSWRTLMA